MTPEPKAESACKRPHRVVTLGEAMLRLSPPSGTRLDAADRLDVHVAGAESNVAANLACLDVPTAWLSALPDNPLGRRTLSVLAGLGVDVDHVALGTEGRMGVFFVEPGVGSRPTTVLYDRSGSAFSLLPPGSLDLTPLRAAEWAVVSGVTPALSTDASHTTREFVDFARESGAQVCIDVNYRGRLWPATEARKCLGPILSVAALVVCSKRDAASVFGLSGTDGEVLDGLRSYSPAAELIVLTTPHGSEARARDGAILAAPRVPGDGVVDRLGIGDAFLAGVLFGLLEGGPGEALERGAAMAALKASVTGDIARVRRAELEEFMSSSTRDVVR